MLLSPQDVALFFKLHRALMFFVNQCLIVIPDDVASPNEFSSLSPEVRLKVRDSFLSHTDLIQQFVAENPAQLTTDELAIVRSWQYRVHGKFYIFRQLKKYMVFLSTDKPPVAYGVWALSQSFEELVGPYLPVLAETVLLPFKGMIVYDGLMSRYKISFGGGIKKMLNENFKEAKARHGIVTSLPLSSESLPPRVPKPKRVPRSPTREEKYKAVQDVIGLIDPFCKEHLNEEYAVLCRKLAEKLCRKRPSPLLHGSPNAWASGIVRAVGGVNFLHDKSQSPYMRSTDIDHYFGTSPSSGAAKLAAIRKMFRMQPFDHEWTLPSHMDDNPLTWMVQIDGLLVDIRHAPRHLQEIAFNKGLIPYIPADRRQAQE
jgi:hypothetical protein